MKELTILQAYQSAFLFLDSFWEQYKVEFHDNLPRLLGVMQLLKDGLPLDRALMDTWMQVLPKAELQTVNTTEAFEMMVAFLKSEQRGETDYDISRLITMLNTRSSMVMKNWMACVNEVLS